MGGTQSYRRRSRRTLYMDHPGSLPVTPEDLFSGHYIASSYPQMDADPYFQYAGYSGGMRRVSSDPHLFAYDPYMQYGMAQGEQFSYFPCHILPSQL